MSGNPGGRPRSLARYARETVGNDGERIIDFWLVVMDDVTLPTRDRLEASKLLADRGWGKPANFQLVSGARDLRAERRDLIAGPTSEMIITQLVRVVPEQGRRRRGVRACVREGRGGRGRERGPGT